MKSRGDEKEAGACVASTAFLSWHSRSMFQVLRGAELERCSCFWMKATSELWDLWCSLLASQSRKKVCLSQCTVYPERFVKETSLTGSPSSGWLSVIACSRWREMSSPVSALLMRMDSNLCLCSPAEMKCHLNHLCTENEQCCRQLLPTFQVFHHYWKPRSSFDNGFITVVSSCLPSIHSCAEIGFPQNLPWWVYGCGEIHWDGKGNL